MNCMCLWDELFNNMRVYFSRRREIVPIFVGVGEMDTGTSYFTPKKGGFMGGMHPSSEKNKTPIQRLFPQARIGGTDTYAEYGVASLKLSNPTAAKQVYLIAMDPGLTISMQDVKNKEIFRHLKPQDIVIVMWPAALHPGCKYSKWLFNVDKARQEWSVFFDQYADVVVEGGGSFKALKRYRDVNNLNDNLINTVYIGDTFISGNPPAGEFTGEDSVCIQEDADDSVDQFRYKHQSNPKQRHAWYITVGGDHLEGKASLNKQSEEFDKFSIKI